MTISIVVAVRAERLPVLNLLASINGLKERARLEVAVVNCCGEPAAAEIGRRFPEQRIIDVPAHLTRAQARYEGVKNTSGEIVAILHERYCVSDAWLAALESAHQRDVDVIGGPVAPRPGLNGEAWAIYLAEYSANAPPLAEGPLDRDAAVALPGGNASYKRRVFGMARMQDALWELDFHESLHRAGARFYRSAAMCAEYGTPPDLEEYYGERRRASREYGAFHSRGATGPARFMQAAARIALPPLMLSRYARRALAKPGLRGRFWPALPRLAYFSWIQMTAEMTGILSSQTPPEAAAPNGPMKTG